MGEEGVRWGSCVFMFILPSNLPVGKWSTQTKYDDGIMNDYQARCQEVLLRYRQKIFARLNVHSTLTHVVHNFPVNYLLLYLLKSTMMKFRLSLCCWQLVVMKSLSRLVCVMFINVDLMQLHLSHMHLLHQPTICLRLIFHLHLFWPPFSHHLVSNLDAFHILWFSTRCVKFINFGQLSIQFSAIFVTHFNESTNIFLKPRKISLHQIEGEQKKGKQRKKNCSSTATKLTNIYVLSYLNKKVFN